jgi:hypothetical protein
MVLAKQLKSVSVQALQSNDPLKAAMEGSNGDDEPAR